MRRSSAGKSGRLHDPWRLPQVCLVDRSDGIVANKQNGSLWAIEHKTTGANLTTEFKLAYRMDPQIMAHIYCWRSEGYDVKGVLMNVIQFKKVIQQTTAKCKVHKIEQRLCWAAHLGGEMFYVEPPPGVYARWLEEQQKNAAHYRDLLLGGGTPGMQGLVNGTCKNCSFSGFCYKGREAFDLLIKRDSPSWVTRSGLYD